MVWQAPRMKQRLADAEQPACIQAMMKWNPPLHAALHVAVTLFASPSVLMMAKASARA
jgi:hypothetical protein